MGTANDHLSNLRESLFEETDLEPEHLDILAGSDNSAARVAEGLRER
jgi:hypothetical protein